MMRERLRREEMLRGEAQWTGTPRARPLYEWSSSLSTACTDARGRRVVHIHIYINVVWEAMRRGLLIHAEEKMKRTNARTNSYIPCNPNTPTTLHPYKPTVHSLQHQRCVVHSRLPLLEYCSLRINFFFLWNDFFVCPPEEAKGAEPLHQISILGDCISNNIYDK